MTFHYPSCFLLINLITLFIAINCFCYGNDCYCRSLSFMTGGLNILLPFSRVVSMIMGYEGEDGNNGLHCMRRIFACILWLRSGIFCLFLHKSDSLLDIHSTSAQISSNHQFFSLTTQSTYSSWIKSSLSFSQYVPNTYQQSIY